MDFYELNAIFNTVRNRTLMKSLKSGENGVSVQRRASVSVQYSTYPSGIVIGIAVSEKNTFLANF